MSIFLEDSNKPKILFLHGFSSNKKFINSILKLRRDFTIASIDLHYKGTNSLLKMVENVKETIEQNNWNELVVVGHSMGGGVATMLSNMEQVKKIILIAPLNPFFKQPKNIESILLPKNQEEALEALELVVYNKNTWTEVAGWDFLTKSYVQYSKVNHDDLFPMIKNEFMNQDFLKQHLAPFYDRFSSKFNLIIGQDDQLIPLESMDHIAQTWKIPIFKIEYCGHIPLFEKPEETIEIINKII